MPITVDLIVDALSALGGRAHLDDIVDKVSSSAPPPLPVDVGASVRARIQERSSDAGSYKGGVDLFYSVHGVDARQGWWGLRTDPLAVGNEDGFQDNAEAFIEHEEGRAELRVHLRRERSRKLVADFKATLTDFRCRSCGFDFEQVYGHLGAGYVEAHHTIPVAFLTEGAATKTSDLVALCANCHRMVHRNGLLPWQELSALVKGCNKAS